MIKSLRIKKYLIFQYIPMNKIYKWFENRINPYPENINLVFNNNLLQFINSCTKGIRFWIILLLLFNALVGIFHAYLFYILNHVVDWLSIESKELFWQHKINNIYFIVVFIIFGFIMDFFANVILMQTILGNFPMRLRWVFHNHLLSQSITFYQNEFAGRIATKIMQTSLAIRSIITTFCEIFVYVLIFFVSIMLMLFKSHYLLVIPFLIWLTCLVIISKVAIPKISKSSMNQADARSMMTGRITDAYTNIGTVKLFSHADNEAKYAKQAMNNFLQTVFIQMRYVTSFNVFIIFVNLSLDLIVILLSIHLWANNYISIGVVATAIAIAMRLNGMAQWITYTLAQFFEEIGTTYDGMSLLTKPIDIKDHENATNLTIKGGEIKFENVCFQYNDNNVVFDNLNLNIKSREKIGLIGYSGAGKSTIVNLILRLFDTTSGRILIDGQDIKMVTQKSLRENIAMVTQDTSLLHRTIRENIAYGKTNATEEEIIAAAKKANAHEFIMALKDYNNNTGYDAQVGERGAKLSGGQKQRIAIARVILKNAPILILDEATSALDSEVESAIQENLYELMHNKTVMVIAHRLSTIKSMDKLIILDKGKIVEVGTHDELIKLNKIYAKLWARQSGGFLNID